MDEIQIREKVGTDEKSTFESLVFRYREQALRVAFRYLRNWEEAADCVQEAFLKAFDGLNQNGFPQKFSSWFFRILVNQCLDNLRSARKRLEMPLEMRGEPQTGGFEEQVNAHLTAQELLKGLSPKLRSLVILHDLEGFSFAELADMLGRSESAVRGLLFRARKKLAQLFAENEK